MWHGLSENLKNLPPCVKDVKIFNRMYIYVTRILDVKVRKNVHLKVTSLPARTNISDGPAIEICGGRSFRRRKQAWQLKSVDKSYDDDQMMI